MKSSHIASKHDTILKNMFKICEQVFYNVLLQTIFHICLFINFACHTVIAIQMYAPL